MLQNNGESRAQIDFSFLPIGDNFTMVVESAINATGFINCTKVIGMHYDTFGFIKINKPEAVKKFSDAGCQLILFEIGETKAIWYYRQFVIVKHI